MVLVGHVSRHDLLVLRQTKLDLDTSIFGILDIQSIASDPIGWTHISRKAFLKELGCFFEGFMFLYRTPVSLHGYRIHWRLEATLVKTIVNKKYRERLIALFAIIESPVPVGPPRVDRARQASLERGIERWEQTQDHTLEAQEGIRADRASRGKKKKRDKAGRSSIQNNLQLSRLELVCEP